mgnify:CR=1 FL=1
MCGIKKNQDEKRMCSSWIFSLMTFLLSSVFLIIFETEVAYSFGGSTCIASVMRNVSSCIVKLILSSVLFRSSCSWGWTFNFWWKSCISFAVRPAKPATISSSNLIRIVFFDHSSLMSTSRIHTLSTRSLTTLWIDAFTAKVRFSLSRVFNSLYWSMVMKL